MEEWNFHAQCPTGTLHRGFLFIEPFRLGKPSETIKPNPSLPCPLTMALTFCMPST